MTSKYTILHQDDLSKCTLPYCLYYFITRVPDGIELFGLSVHRLQYFKINLD